MMNSSYPTAPQQTPSPGKTTTLLVSLCVLVTGSAVYSGCKPGPIKDDYQAPPADEDFYWPTDSDIIQEHLLYINRLDPDKSPTGEQVWTDVIGMGFTDATRVWFGELECEQVMPGNGRLTVAVPPVEVGHPGWVDVRVEDELGNTSSLPNGFYYYDEVAVTDVIPHEVRSRGGDQVMLAGIGFIDATLVYFGDQPALSSQRISATRISARVPDLPPGWHNVTVVNEFHDNDQSSMPRAIIAMGLVTVESVSPVYGPLTGGSAVTVSGSGYRDGTTLAFGGMPLAITQRSPEGLTLGATTTDAGSEGVVDVFVGNSWGRASLEDGFAFIDLDDPTLRVIAIIPPAGPAQGQNMVNIVGVGLDGSSLVHFGTQQADCSQDSGYLISCIAPPGSDGTVDVSIQAEGGSLLVPGGYTYIEISLEGINPDSGAIAGGTYANVMGSGFAEGTRVFFNDAPAQIIEVASTQVVVLRTPPGTSGPAMVRVERFGVSVERGDLFTYFNPANYYDWTSGGKIEGALNVTVTDAYTGLPIEGAFVVIGSDPLTERAGYTNARGQLTISDPGLLGPLDVTAGKPTYSNQSWVGVDAANVEMWLYPPIPDIEDPPEDTDQGDPPPPPPSNPLLRGSVLRIKDAEVEAGNRVWVFTTNRYPGSVPQPQSGGVVDYEGDFEITSRPGEVCLVAVAGTHDAYEGTFTVEAMGLRPFLYLSYDQVYEDQDIYIDTPMDAELQVHLVDPPLGVEGGPGTSALTISIDLGAMGYIPWPRIRGIEATLNAPMPSVLPFDLGDLRVIVKGGVYGIGLTLPMSEVYYGIVDDISTPIFLTPVLGTLSAKVPANGEYLGGSYHFELDTNADPEPTSTLR